MTNKKTFVSIMLVAVLILSLLCAVACYLDDNTKPSGPNPDANGVVDVYAINDFHGATDKMPRIAGYLAARKAEGAVIINSGDMFQGSMESNSNFGRLLTDCMVEAKFDAMTYGNHEFDWGMDNLRDLANSSGVPFLGANIYNWSRDDGWGEFADNFADEYVIVESGDLKVGVIGVIGDDQITSISSQLVQTIGFKDPLPIIKELATELRTEKGCDIVVVSAHDGPQDIVDGSGDTYDEPTTTAGLEDYVDGVFCAHTHSQQRFLVNGLPFLQGKRYGDYVSHMRFSVENGNVSVETYENIPYSSLSGKTDATVENNVKTLIDESNDLIAEERNQVLTRLSSSMTGDEAIPRMVCHAIADYAAEQGHEIVLAMCNEARSTLSSGNLTYTKLYNALPFDNVVYIAKVSGRDIINEMRYSAQMWRVSNQPIVNSNNTYYTVAVIDYLLYHQNANRNYNYFPSAFNSGFDPIPLTKEDVQIYNYRLITRDFLLGAGATLDVTTYTVLNAHTDSSLLSSSVNF